MRSLKGWKAFVCLAAVMGILLSPAGQVLAETVGVGIKEGDPVPQGQDDAIDLGLSDRYYYPRANYVWPYATGPFYGLVEPMAKKSPGVLVTSVGSFKLNTGDLPIPTDLRVENKVGEKGEQYFVVQLHPDSVTTKGREAMLSAIERTGGEVMRYMPVSSMLVRLTPEAYTAVQGTPGLMAIEPYHAAFKLSPMIGRTPLLDRNKATAEVYDLDILLFRGEDPQTVAPAITDLGGKVTRVWKDRIFAQLHHSRLAELAKIDAVYSVSEAITVSTMAQESAMGIQIGSLQRAPYNDAGITGTDQVLMVLDNGMQLDAGDLSDTATTPGIPGPAHRKVRAYEDITNFGGLGDDLGCDGPAQGGFTHGHMVSASALGNPQHASTTFQAVDVNGTPWDLFGVAPDALLAFYDANRTPAVGSCQDPLLGALDPGDLYVPGIGDGSMDHAYENYDARIFNFSFGSSNLNFYSPNTEDVDSFLNDFRDAMVFVAAGNEGRDANNDSIPDPGSVSDLGTSKNAVVVGAHGYPDDQGTPANIQERASFSAIGPAGATGRFAPLLMAPGQERGTTGVNSEFSCRSSDNDNGGAVICDQVTGKAGTSFASPAAAGAGMLIRSYFAQGFYPDGTDANSGNAGDQVANISGALTKAVLVVSAEYLGRDFSGQAPFGIDNLTIRQRGNQNFEQGYGRIQLDNALPLESWSESATGLIVTDGGITAAGGGGAGANINDLGGTITGQIDAVGGATQSATFDLCDDTQELRVALTWTEALGDGAINDLDLELVSPSGKLYYGNYFTDDDNGDGIVDPLSEDCPTVFNDGTPGDNGWDRSEWSLETCVRADPPTLPPHDALNTTEAIFLSPNPEGNVDRDGEEVLRGGSCSVSLDACGYKAQCPIGEECLGGTAQIEAGTWTVSVIAKNGGADSAQGYAIAVAGGVCLGSSARFDKTSYVCNDDAKVTINERGEASDPAGGLSIQEIASRTTVQVLAADGVTVLDSEPGSSLNFDRPDANVLQFVAEGVSITDGTAYQAGNGVLDVRNGNIVRVVYEDKSNGVEDADKVRVSDSTVGCQVDLLTGATTFAQFGRDTSFFLVGGCERNAGGLFDFGFPDKYMDAGEQIGYRFAFSSLETDNLGNAEASLRCVLVDADSPADCKPGTTSCADPDRTNNTPCGSGIMTIVDSPKNLGTIQPNTVTSANFQIRVNAGLTGTPTVEMLLGISGDASGKTVASLAANRHKLNVDEVSKWYSTDFPTGGTEITDRNNNGVVQGTRAAGADTGDPSRQVGGDIIFDYVFEQVTYSDMTAGTNAAGAAVTVNDDINAPWHFDTNDGGYTTGVNAASDATIVRESGITIAQWGEDLNFNNQLDGQCASAPSVRCDRFPDDPINCGVDFVFTCINLEDRDPENFPLPLLDQNHSLEGGCGWQTKAPGTCFAPGGGGLSGSGAGCYGNGDCPTGEECIGPEAETGGIWHTGRIGDLTSLDCAVAGDAAGQCQIYEVIPGTTGQLLWFELLRTPVMTKVNQALDATGEPAATAEMVEWRWNQAIDLADNNVSYVWELDVDSDKLEPQSLEADLTVDNGGTGEYGAAVGEGNPALSRGWSAFAPLNAGTGQSQNGTRGNNRVGDNSCFFENGAVAVANSGISNTEGLGVAKPLDDDANEGFCDLNGNGQVDDAAKETACTNTCSAQPSVSCDVDADCVGTCINPGLAGFCDNDPTGPTCTQDADCSLGTCVDVSCNGTCVASACTNTGNACSSDADCTLACTFSNASIDEFVVANGPVRNHELNDWNGPDMRFFTLEDTFGDVGNHFQGAIGFQNREAANPNDPEAQSGYGLGVDDVVLYWREFTLDEDTHDCDAVCVGGANDGQPCSSDAECGAGGGGGAGFCGGGSCATINLTTNGIFEGNTLVGITVVDTSPSDNDCDFDSVVDDPPTRDCNGNGIDDVVVRVNSRNEIAGEIAYLDSIGSSTYTGEVPISSAYNVAGTLFVATEGNQVPVVTALYIDLDDGTGNVCPNSFDQAAQGRIQQTSTVFITPATLVVTRTNITDNGDNDGWGDDFETVTMQVEVANKSGQNVTGLTLRMSTNDPSVACVTLPFLEFGDLADGETRFSETGFEFIIANVNRQDSFEDLTATLSVGLDADQFQSPTLPQSVTIDLDLDATGGAGPTTYFESFEAGFGTFTTMQLDADMNPPEDDLGNFEAGVINADGARCQYSDPDWEQAASFGNSNGNICFPAPNGAPDTFFWGTTTDRSFSGNAALNYGVFFDAALGFGTPSANLEAVRSIEPVNLGWDRVCEIDRTIFCDSSADCPTGGGGEPQACVNAQPVFSFKHQVSFLDHRRVNAQPGRSPERGVIYGQLADNDGNPVGDWIRLEPFVNSYDSQANWNYFNCTFDPRDDGTTEDDFFDPTDPTRFFGPSSTCEPNFTFVYAGETGFVPFSTGNLGDALDGPGLSPILDGSGTGAGTWLEPKIDLNRFRGRRMRFRFLFTSLKLGGVITWESIFVFNPDPRDDGWFIDDVTVTDALTTPASVSPDSKDNSALPGCGVSCTTVTADATVDPATSGAPGQVIEIDGAPTTVDRCIGGVLEWAFWLDVNRDGDVDPGFDVLIRDFTQNDTLLDTPQGTSDYIVVARCATAPDCNDEFAFTVSVDCPTGAAGLGVSSDIVTFLGRNPSDRRAILADNAGNWFWASDATVDVLRGDLFALRAGGSFVSTSATCIMDNGVPFPPASGAAGTQTNSVNDTTNPGPGEGLYYLAASAPNCNVQAQAGYGNVGEVGGSQPTPTRDLQLAGTCP